MNYFQYIDIYDKVENDEFRQYTKQGKMQTRIFLTYTILIIFEEFLFSLLPHYTRELTIDPSVIDNTGKVNISMSLIVYTPCQLLSFSANDVLGHSQDSESGLPYLTFRRISINGTFINYHNGSKIPNSQCGPCYNLRKDSRSCCNSCSYLTLLSLKKGITPTPQQWSQCDGPDDITTDEICLIKGKIEVNKVSGRFAILTDSYEPSYNNLNEEDQISLLDMSHYIIRLRFGPPIPTTSTPYTYQYYRNHRRTEKAHVHAVVATPVVHIRNGKVIQNGYEYITVPTSKKAVKNVPKISFSYSFSPYTVTVNGESPKVFQVLTTFMGMISGAFAIFSFLNEYVQKKIGDAFEDIEKTPIKPNETPATQ